jgi:hypothetical protein
MQIYQSVCFFIQQQYIVEFAATSAVPTQTSADKELVFLNYTFKRFDGMTQRLGMHPTAVAAQGMSTSGHSRSQMVNTSMLQH